MVQYPRSYQRDRWTIGKEQNPNLTNKSWVVHHYCTLMACGDGSSFVPTKTG